MKYVILIYTNAKNWEHPIFAQTPEFLALPDDERERLLREDDEVIREIHESGELVTAGALADPMNTMTVQRRDGAPMTTDGPYMEAKEQLAGFFVVDCETPERAAEIAGRFPDTRFSPIEVRPIMEMSGQEM
ncbi:YciI family protein [Phytoactinopolyspora halotolerans]|uniref:YciI family protein n=1 Tax=Phytoactinopolyspora halotolerans TaxID=1981512 RepID=A0A6L9SEA3_9ACTN|nr:YciI family protein [Phytoactinopolyspora halotolerans]NEE02410.1 YciI family protein [Phytoactinopolyspora halotolerans]